jgi:hypothetical protein
VVTVVQRFVYVYRHADGVGSEAPTRKVEPAALDTLAKGR